jgi:hypothetical protein
MKRVVMFVYIYIYIYIQMQLKTVSCCGLGFYNTIFNLTIAFQQGATYSLYYISVGISTCFGCRHPSSGARTVTAVNQYQKL